jgi:hypothetical protein
MNHSCHSCLSPFLFVRGKDNSRQYPQLGFVFTRPIAAGNEITIDYARGYWENADYDCNCGTFTCLKPSSTTRCKFQRNKSYNIVPHFRSYQSLVKSDQKLPNTGREHQSSSCQRSETLRKTSQIAPRRQVGGRSEEIAAESFVPQKAGQNHTLYNL